MTLPSDAVFGSMLLFALVSALPLLAAMATAFVKISVVLLILRNALGIQQTPPNLVIFSVAIVLTAFVMYPVATGAYAALDGLGESPRDLAGMVSSATRIAEPFRDFMLRFAPEDTRNAFLDLARRIWPAAATAVATSRDFAILVPAFMAAELTRAFEIGFLLYLPFLVIDFAVSAILIGLGMQMMSPPVIATPLKLLLFVAVEGWYRVLEGLVLSYAPV